jgi:hypothetical protein
MDRCDIVGGLLSWGINQAAERAGLAPIPLGGGDVLELNPGFLVKHEFRLLCKKDSTPSLFTLDLKGLSFFTQSYLIDRMQDLSGAQMDKSLGIPGQRLALPSFGLGVFHLPGEGSVVLWRDPNKQGLEQLNGVMVRFTLPLGK